MTADLDSETEGTAINRGEDKYRNSKTHPRTFSFFKQKELKTRITSKVFLVRFLIILLTAIAIIFFLSLSLRAVTVTEAVKRGDETLITERTKTILDSQQIENFDFDSVLTSIATAFSAILAIVFAFSQIILSSISDRYTPHILEKYRRDKKTYSTFLVFIMTILLSIFSIIFLEKVPAWVKFLIISVTIVLVGSCFYLFVGYFDYIFEVINPMSFIERLRKEVNRDIEKISADETKFSITSLGDIAVKSFKRNEDEVVKKALDEMYRVFENYLELRRRHPGTYPLEHDIRRSRNPVFVYLLDQQLRLFKNAVQLKNENITLNVSIKLYDYLLALLWRENNSDLVRQIVETTQFHGTYFSQFLSAAIEYNDPSKRLLIRIIPDILQVNRHSDTKICDSYIEDLILTHIFRSNQAIIDHDDFDLFRNEIDDYCNLLIGYNPLSIRGEMEDFLYFHDIPSQFFNNKQEVESFGEDTRNLRSFLRFRLYFDRERYKEFNSTLKDFLDKAAKSLNSIDIDAQMKDDPDRYKNWTDEGIEKLKQKDISHRLYDLYVSSILHQAFFSIGWYTLFCKHQNNLDAKRYLNVLWEHTRPEDSDAHIINEPPVSFDLEFATNILFYGSQRWIIPPLLLSDFHGTSKYIYHYYLLLLTYSRNKFNHDLRISLDRRDTQTELEEKYRFLCRFIEKGKEQDGIGDLIKYIDELIDEADEWDTLIGSKEKGIRAEEAFKDTREWIRKKVIEFQELEKQIEARLPIDAEKKKKCREEILAYYKNTSMIHKIVNQEEYKRKEGMDMDFVQISERPCWPKSCFLRISTVHSIWGDLGGCIASGEKGYVLEQIMRDERIERIALDSEEGENIELLFSRIFGIIQGMIEDDLNPSLLFVPNKYYTEIMSRNYKSDSILKGRIECEDTDNIICDGNAKLELFFSSRILPFDDIIILDKDFGTWTYQVDDKTGERLFIDIDEYEEDRSQVVLYVRTIINLRITSPERVRILGV